MTSSVYSHAVRVLLCDHCGAPLEAAIAGGGAQCQYCGTTNQLVQRDESQDLADAQQAQAAQLSESERIQQLRAQDNQAALPPPSLQHLLRGTELNPARLEEARQEWLAARRRLLSGGGFTAAERLFHLTLLIAPLQEDRPERALLENAIEVLPDARHRQLIRCRMAHKAVLSGDLQAASEWLRPCNPRPTDLGMDTAYRIASAYLATAQGQADQVLNLLGDHVDDIPIADGHDDEAAFLRVNSIERTRGPAAATAAFKALLMEDLRRLAGFHQTAQQNERLGLCAQSWPAVHGQAWALLEKAFRIQNTDYGCLTAGAIISALILAVAPAALIWDWGGEGEGQVVLAANAAVWGGLAAAFTLTMFFGYRRAKHMQAHGVLGMVRVLSAEQKLEATKNSSKTFQILDVVVDTPSGPVEGTHRMRGDQAPAPGVYPCLYDPLNPAKGLYLELSGARLRNLPFGT